jgi:hypothetical protein
MAFIVADRVRDTSITTGTGPFALSGTAPNAYQTFSAVCAVNDTFLGWIANQSANEWEVGLYTYSAANQITRTVVNASSNGGAAVVFTAGTKDVVLSPNALGGNLLFSDGTGLKSNEAGNPNILLVNSVASAVNWLEITNAATGVGNVLSAKGTDADVGIILRPKTTNAGVVNPTKDPLLEFDFGYSYYPTLQYTVNADAAMMASDNQPGIQVYSYINADAGQAARCWPFSFGAFANNSANTRTNFADMWAFVYAVTAGAEYGAWYLGANNNGVGHPQIWIGDGVHIGGAGFNPDVGASWPGYGNLSFNDNNGIYVAASGSTSAHPALIFQDTTSAVNWLEITNQVTTVNPTIGAAGETGRGVGFTTYVELTEMTAPAAGPVNTCRLFTQDNGGGKTQLMAIFNTGAAQQVAIQP